MHTRSRRTGQLRVVRGGCYGRRPSMRRTDARDWQLDRAMRDAFVTLTTEAGRVPSRGIQEVREGRTTARPWRVLARRFREAADAGVPKERALRVVRVWETWLDEIYGPSAA